MIHDMGFLWAGTPPPLHTGEINLPVCPPTAYFLQGVVLVLSLGFPSLPLRYCIPSYSMRLCTRLKSNDPLTCPLSAFGPNAKSGGNGVEMLFFILPVISNSIERDRIALYY